MGNHISNRNQAENARIVSLLGKLEMFSKEKPANLGKIASALTLCNFSKNDVILNAGAEAKCLYIIVNGEVSFHSRDPSTNQVIPLSVLGSNQTFGEFALVYDVRRTASAVAATDCTLLRLDREVYEKISNSKYMGKLTERVKSVCVKIMSNGLGQIPIFKEFPKEDIEALGNLFRFEVLPGGRTICREGEEADRFFILFKGEVVMTMVDDLGFHTEVKKLQQSDSFGQDALLKDVPHYVSVTTLNPCELFSLGKDEFKLYYKSLLEDRGIKGYVTKHLEENMPVFKHLKLRNRGVLGVTSIPETFEKGKVILREGDTNNKNIYVLYDGQVSIRKGEKTIRTMQTGYFGEVALYRGLPNTSSVVVDSETVQCLKLSTDVVGKILREEPAINAEIGLRVFGEQAGLEEILRHPQAQKSFLTYCEKEYAQENVAFWEEVTYLEDLASRETDPGVLQALQVNPQSDLMRKRDMMVTRCKDILENYVVPGSRNEINISGAAREELMEKYKNEDFSFSMFEQARTEVFTLIEQDNFSRYKASTDFSSLLDSIGVYSDVNA